MALRSPGSGPRTEPCEACGRDTPHAVRIDILTESDDPNAPGYSREPYRVATCRECGRTTRRRMNGA